MTMERAITILRKSGWRIEVNDTTKRIVLQDPFPDANWLHLLRAARDREEGPDGASQDQIETQ
jgi:hypothetical protein